MTALALVVSMSLPLVVAAAQQAEVPPVPPPAGETTPVPPPAPTPDAQPAPAPAPEAQPAPTPPPQTQPAPAPAPGAAPAPEAAPAPAPTPTPTPDVTPVPMPDVAPAPVPSPDAPAPDAPAPSPDAPAPAPSPDAAPPVVGEAMPEPGPAPSPAPGTEPAVAVEPSTVPATGPATGPAAGAAPAPPAVVDPSNPALAERLTSMATGLLRSQPPSNALWRYVTSLLQAATRLAPTEPRFARFLIEAAGRAGDEETLLKALENYRKLVPTDEHAQAQLIDLYLKRMQSADSRIKYLQGIIESPLVSPPVRSVAAMRLAGGMAERMQNDLAGEAVGIALQLNPLNLDALRLRHEQAQQAGQPAERLAAQLALLQSNPAQPTVAGGVARELADAGLLQRSLDWFRQSLAMHSRMGIVPPPDLGVDFAAELFISGEARQAMQVVEQITAANPDDLNAWLLKLILARHAGNKELQAQTLQRATVALTNRMATLSKAAGNNNATTRPVDFSGEVPLPDPMQDLEQIAGNKPELVTQYAPVAGGMAWLKIFFEEKPAQAVPFTNAVAKAMGDSYEVVARLQGWQYMVAGNKDDARVKLSAVADRDPIAALGMIRLAAEKDPAAQQKATEDARKLLEQYPSRLTGAFLMAELHKRGVKVVPGPGAPALEKELATFPKDWMRIIDQPQLFYSVRVEPVAGRVSVPVGEPVLVQVTVFNTSNFPLTMGPEGVIHPDLWFDAQTRGGQNQFFPAEAFARLSGPMVLAPRNGVITQVVRLDQAQLLGLLERFPTAHFQIMAMVMTNPTTVNGRVQPGPAGNQVALAKMMERRGAPIGQLDVRQKLGEAIQNGTPEQKIQAAETLTKFATLFNGPGAGEEAKAFGAQAAEAVRHTANDPDPTVRAWASYLYSVYTGEEQLLRRLVHDPSWIARTLGIVAVDYTGKDQQLFKDLATTDEEPLVKNLAAAALEAKIARAPAVAGGGAATQPAAAAGGGGGAGGAAATQAATQPNAPVPASSTTQPDQPAAAGGGGANATPAVVPGEPAAPALTPGVPGATGAAPTTPARATPVTQPSP